MPEEVQTTQQVEAPLPEAQEKRVDVPRVIKSLPGRFGFGSSRVREASGVLSEDEDRQPKIARSWKGDKGSNPVGGLPEIEDLMAKIDRHRSGEASPVTEVIIPEDEKANLANAADRLGFSADLLVDPAFVDALGGVMRAEGRYFEEAFKARELKSDLEEAGVVLPALGALLDARMQVLSTFKKQPGQVAGESAVTVPPPAEKPGDSPAADVNAVDSRQEELVGSGV